jgi:hypothetical protein
MAKPVLTITGTLTKPHGSFAGVPISLLERFKIEGIGIHDGDFSQAVLFRPR